MTHQSLQSVYQNFLHELEQAAKNEKSSLPYIINTIPSESLVKDQETFQVMAIGGTVFRSAILQKQGNNITILHIEKEDLPVFPTKNSLMAFVEKRIKPDITNLAVNFAYAIKPIFERGRLDGILLVANKENAFEGLIGKKVGEAIEEYIYQKRKQHLTVCVVNDTVGLVLSGITTHPWQHIAAGIVGTGVNFAIMTNADTVVNLESSTFDKFVQTEAGKIIDASSLNPGKQLFEKETSGKYLYRHFNYLVDQNSINCNHVKNTMQLSMLAEEQIPDFSEQAQNILDHSAQLVATQVAGILSFLKRDITFIMQGSLFWKGNRYKETVERYTKQLEPTFTATFTHIDNSDILGAAKLII